MFAEKFIGARSILSAESAVLNQTKNFLASWGPSPSKKDWYLSIMFRGIFFVMGSERNIYFEQ